MTDHAAAEEQGLDHPNLIFLTTKQPPLCDGCAARAPDPLPRPGLKPTHAFRRGVANPRPLHAPPIGFAVGEYHDHGVEGLQSPRQARQDEVPQLPPPELTAISPEHVVDAELLLLTFSGDRLPRRRLKQRRPELRGSLSGSA
ncbi:Organic cation/carnitine transporter 4 [Senna tora]|uniref:Organic cation/carnitine transporter 4 n=1 Tax=Senna tora TaxID=362788 RepID=A0A834WWP9_9FABA|nr:Organic cation/carnitine transporter 4 [Senna tora]